MIKFQNFINSHLQIHADISAIRFVKNDTWATRTQGLDYNIICRELFNILQWKNPIQVIFKIVGKK